MTREVSSYRASERMLSRIAENLYWMGRYVERAENTARLLDVNYHAIIEAPLAPGASGIVDEQWAPLLAIGGEEDDFRSHFDRADAASVPHWLTVHPANPSSVRSALGAARENARTLRDRISSEMWEALNRAWLRLGAGVDAPPEEDALHDYCVAAREASHLFFGIADATLPRDLGWYFIRAGQYLERADNAVRTLMVRYRRYGGMAPVAAGLEAHRGMALLKSLSAYEAFRKRYRAAPTADRIAEFLLLDPHFPRSFRFAVRVLAEILAEVETRNPDTSGEPQRQASWLGARLVHATSASDMLGEDVHAIDDGDDSLERLLEELADISHTIAATYFDPAPRRS